MQMRLGAFRLLTIVSNNLEQIASLVDSGKLESGL